MSFFSCFSYQYDLRRMVGPDLTASHFLVHRYGAVRFQGNAEWTKKDKNGEYCLPRYYDPDFKVEAMDFSKTDVMWRSLDNFSEFSAVDPKISMIIPWNDFHDFFSCSCFKIPEDTENRLLQVLR